MPNPVAFRFGYSLMRFVWAIWLAPYRIAVVGGIGLLLAGVGLVWRWLQIPTRQFFGVDVDAQLFFASSVPVFALLVAIVVPVTILIVISVVWRLLLERADEKVPLLRNILKDSLARGHGLAFLSMNYRGVIIEAFDEVILRQQLARTGVDMAEKEMLRELRRLGAQALLEVDQVNTRFRHLKLGHMSRIIFDPKHGGGMMYFHVHANQYLFGCVIEKEPLEPKNGQLPPAFHGMEEMVKAIRAALGLAILEPAMPASPPA